MKVVMLTDEQIVALENGQMIKTSLNGEIFGITTQSCVDDTQDIDSGWSTLYEVPLGLITIRKE